MKVIFYDIILLAIFVIFVAQFLYRNRKNLKREGLLLLYRTTWGMKFIDRVGKKYQKTLGVLSYISIIVGYFLMAGIIYLVGKIIYLYIAYPNIVRAIRVPPIMPLIPYIDKVAPNIGLPPFYFIYFILILAVIAISHEFAHGIFMRRYGIKIKSTGFGFFPFFLPIFLAAFVEQDETSMKKSKRFNQMAVLSAGTFANILTAILFFGVMVLFFVLAFAPAGIQFNTYSYSVVGISAITNVNGIGVERMTYDNLVGMMNPEGLNEIYVGDQTYVITKDILASQETDGTINFVYLYDDAPAIRVELDGAIIEFDGEKITSWDGFAVKVNEHSPGDNVTIKTKVGDDVKEYVLELGENPDNPEKPFIGIGYGTSKRSGVLGGVVDSLSSFKKDHIYYEPGFDAAEFIYNFLWWLVLISLSVALINMLPVGIFDGGRFFYLTILGITGSERKAEKSFRWITAFFLFLLLVLMFFWVKSFIG